MASYIFVDIDGVLNTRSHLIHQMKSTGECTAKNWFPKSCSNLVRLCEYFDARIVVSSNWRHQYTLNELRQFFASNNIPKRYVVDVTPSAVIQADGENYCRGHEIKDWLDNHAPLNASYLIIDDAAGGVECK
jgi:hypothetical protein